LRIRCKRLRYAAEFFAELFGRKRAQAYIRSLADVQDVLGVLNDGQVVDQLMAQILTHDETASADLVRGWTAAKMVAKLDQFTAVWDDFSGRDRFWI